jgi:hypothetical protein
MVGMHTAYVGITYDELSRGHRKGFTRTPTSHGRVDSKHNERPEISQGGLPGEETEDRLTCPYDANGNAQQGQPNINFPTCSSITGLTDTRGRNTSSTRGDRRSSSIVRQMGSSISPSLDTTPAQKMFHYIQALGWRIMTPVTTFPVGNQTAQSLPVCI